MTDEIYKGTKLDYPKMPCHVCKGDRFWYRGKDWLCMRCTPPPKDSKEELIARAMVANHKMYLAWYDYMQYRKSDPGYEEMRRQFHEGTEKAVALGRQLKERGITDCLYIQDGKKLKKCNIFPNLYTSEPTIENFFCHCCPNDYWIEQELFDYDDKMNRRK